jgi:hypothetical protein
MEALGDHGIETATAAPARLLSRAHARLRAWRLDHDLIGGADPRSSPVLAARAAQLTGIRSRERLATRLEDALDTSGRPPRMPSAAIQPPRLELEEARLALTEVMAVLRSGGPVYCQGMARLRLLLTDGASPLYYPSHPDELTEVAESIIEALQGR